MLSAMMLPPLCRLWCTFIEALKDVVLDAAHDCPQISAPLWDEIMLFAPRPPPSCPGLYVPFVLSQPSIRAPLSKLAFLHEQMLQVNDVWAMLPAHCDVPPPGLTMTGGPPPAHVVGVGNTFAGTHDPPTQP